MTDGRTLQREVGSHESLKRYALARSTATNMAPYRRDVRSVREQPMATERRRSGAMSHGRVTGSTVHREKSSEVM
jgi:hypothetical protein